MKKIDYTTGSIAEDVVLLLGYFDGMHLGHQKLLARAREIAQKYNYKLAIMTFLGNKDAEVIYTFEERLFTFAQNNIDYCIVADFNAQFKGQTGMQFLKHLQKICPLKAVVCGSDFTFGQAASCNVQALQDFCKAQNILAVVESVCSLTRENLCVQAVQQPAKNTPQDENGQTNLAEKSLPSIDKTTLLTATESGKSAENVQLHESEKISTSKIKAELKKGNLPQVEALLGGKYFILGKVVHGNQLGRTINFPTANIDLAAQKAMLKNGVYAVQVLYKNQLYKGIANLGHKPTVQGQTKLLEVHIFDFQQEIYGEEIVVYFDRFLRDIQKFENLEALKNQIKKDIKEI